MCNIWLLYKLIYTRPIGKTISVTGNEQKIESCPYHFWCAYEYCAREWNIFFLLFAHSIFSVCVRFHWRLNVFSKSQTPISIALLLWRAFKSVRSHMRKQQKYFVKYRWIIEWRAKSDSLSTWLECDTKRKCTALNLSSACLLWMLGLNSQHKVTSKTGIRKIAK